MTCSFTQHYRSLCAHYPNLLSTCRFLLWLQIPVLILIVQFTAVAVTMSIDPAESEVRRKKSRPKPFDRSIHKHVIENNYCNICQIKV